MLDLGSVSSWTTAVVPAGGDDRADHPDPGHNRHSDPDAVRGAAVDLDRLVEVGRRRGDHLRHHCRDPGGKGKVLVRSQLVELLLGQLGLDELATERADLELEPLVLAERSAVVDGPGEEVSDRVEDRSNDPLDRSEGVARYRCGPS